MAALSPVWQDRQRHTSGLIELRAGLDRVKVEHVHAVSQVHSRLQTSTGQDHLEPSALSLGAASNRVKVLTANCAGKCHCMHRCSDHIHPSVGNRQLTYNLDK